MGQVVRYRLQRAQRRKVLAQRWVRNLVDMLRLGQIAQPHGTEVAQRDACGQALGDEIGHCLRQQYLAAVRGAHDSRGTIDRSAKEVVGAALVDAGVQAAARAKGNAFGGFEIGKRLLQLQRGANGVERIVERSMHPVADHLHDGAAIVLDGRPRDAIVVRQRRPHSLGIELPQVGAALEVGEEKRRDRGRFVHARAGGLGDEPILYGSAIASTSSQRV